MAKIFNMTPYEVELFHPCFMDKDEKECIASDGVIFPSASRSSEPSSFIGPVPEWDAGALRPVGVPEHLEDDAVYIVTPAAAIALKAAGYDMSRFRLVDSAELRTSRDGTEIRVWISGIGLARII